MKKILGRILIILIGCAVIFKTVSVWNKDVVQDTEKYTFLSSTDSCLALNYHRVRDRNLWNTILEKVIRPDELLKYSVYTDEFEEQLQRLIDEGAYFATLDEVEEFRKSGNFPEKCVWINFDDSDKTLYDNAFPILKEKNIPFTTFVIVGQVGNKDFSNIELCTWDELREMNESGLVSFGSHTYDMHYLEDNNAKFLKPEGYDDFFIDIKKSKEVLEKELGVSITSIAYPFGESSDSLAELSKEAGFENGFILAPYPITQDNDPYYQNRYMINRENFDIIIDKWLE